MLAVLAWRNLSCGKRGPLSHLRSNPESDVSYFVEANRLCGGRRQIDLPAAYKRAAIVDAHSNASVVTDANKSTEAQCAMRRRHRPAVQSLSIRGTPSAESI
jgi:hypothetical protein